MSPITDAIRIFTHPTFHDITLKIKGGAFLRNERGQLPPACPHFPLKPKQGSSVESQELLKEVFYEI